MNYKALEKLVYQKVEKGLTLTLEEYVKVFLLSVFPPGLG